MPMTFAPSKTPNGHPILRMVSSGEVTAADADNLTRSVTPGGPWENLPLLAIVEAGASFSAEARQAFTRSNDDKTKKRMPVAVVVTSAPLRVMLSFVVRMSGAAGHTRFVSSEAEALSFLDEKLAERPAPA
ncbi:MAG: hypothetical protein Q8L48_36595 [Archangium sp.]|nr:hypothetical protein [Archangium sp.]